jgi:hypothetical protein
MQFLNKKISAILIGVIVLIGFMSWFVFKYEQEKSQSDTTSRSAKELQKQNQDLSKKEEEKIPTTLANMKTYRNEEWGFEFQYPKDWVIRRENTFLTYYSKFFLEISKPEDNFFDSAFIINIVLPEFTSSFEGLEKTTSEIIVGGIKGIKYEYKYQGFLHTAVVLPFGELRMILTTGEGSKQYLDEFNQILNSFKFLK